MKHGSQFANGKDQDHSGKESQAHAPQRVGRVHPQIAWAKLRTVRDGAAIASKKLWS